MSLSDLLHARATQKVLADHAEPHKGSIDPGLLDAMLADAAMAPFHYPHRDHETDGSAVPWRAVKLDGRACRALAKRAEEADLNIGIVARMLRAAEALVLVRYTPEEDRASDRNMEHIAAAGAFAQSLLLIATEAGYRTYWSSGGVLRAPPVTDWMGVLETDILVGALFLFPADIGPGEVKPGKWRDARGAVGSWSRWYE